MFSLSLSLFLFNGVCQILLHLFQCFDFISQQFLFTKKAETFPLPSDILLFPIPFLDFPLYLCVTIRITFLQKQYEKGANIGFLASKSIILVDEVCCTLQISPPKYFGPYYCLSLDSVAGSHRGHAQLAIQSLNPGAKMSLGYKQDLSILVGVSYGVYSVTLNEYC